MNVQPATEQNSETKTRNLKWTWRFRHKQKTDKDWKGGKIILEYLVGQRQDLGEQHCLRGIQT